MKKFLAALTVFLCGAAALFAAADDEADVRAAIIRDCELAAKGTPLDAAARWTSDYREVNPEGAMTCEQAKRALAAMDGKHPVEFMYTLVLVRTGEEPNPDMAEGIRLAARDPEFLKQYRIAAKEMADTLKAAAALELETVKFVGIKVDGDRADAVLTYRHVAGGERRETVSLRRIDGEWRICRRVIENK